ncbi:phosphatidate cytidylyltransferase [Consotaella aegiceratis]|uniref:phosphatidate cytidylyltransferase n=1 Tax=Consotaella aegiceratis TaxID=3097961 RepID=UPI002F3E5124
MLATGGGGSEPQRQGDRAPPSFAAGSPVQGSASRGQSWTDLRVRLISAVLLGAAVLGLTILGGLAFRILCLVAAVIVFDEWTRITRAKADAGPLYQVARLILVAAMAIFVLGFEIAAFWIMAAAVLFGIVADWRARRAGWALGGLCYAALTAVPPAMLRGVDATGLAAIGFVICVVWSTDIFAYFTGRTFGGPKLMPKVSPKKTMSGAVGGLLAGVLLGVGYHWLVAGTTTVSIVLLAGLLSIVGQAGDLFESWVKRRFGVKDSGRILPGHGGLLDRIDALIVALAVALIIGLLTGGLEHPAAVFV